MGDSTATRPSESVSVDAYMERLKHPLSDVVAALRKVILEADRSVGEEVKWNAPAFFYTGEMKAFDPKKYERHLIVFNLFQKNCIRLVFWHGDRANDSTGFLEGDYKDGRRLAMFRTMKDVEAGKKKLQQVVRKQLAALKTKSPARKT
jgi:hypothetical protein